MRALNTEMTMLSEVRHGKSRLETYLSDGMTPPEQFGLEIAIGEIETVAGGRVDEDGQVLIEFDMEMGLLTLTGSPKEWATLLATVQARLNGETGRGWVS